MFFVLLLPIGFIAVFIAIVMAFVGMRKDAQQKKDEAKRIFKRMNIIAAIGFAWAFLARAGKRNRWTGRIRAKRRERSRLLSLKIRLNGKNDYVRAVLRESVKSFVYEPHRCKKTFPSLKRSFPLEAKEKHPPQKNPASPCSLAL
ncbi:hypothetical protein D478_07149 [Brevibacillus agri BAB-2500]|nr:hypothetical protein D478_07149 [Brevibacillus agri BAB-2500]